MDELAHWPGTVLNSHKSAGHPLHRLTFLADLGLRLGDAGMDRIVEPILAHRSPQGPFQVLMNIPYILAAGAGRVGLGFMPCAVGCLRPGEIWAWRGAARPGGNRTPCRAGACQRLALRRFAGAGRGPAGRDARMTPAHLPAWPCSKFLRRYRNGGTARQPAWAPSRCLRCGSIAGAPPLYVLHGPDFSKLKAPLVWFDLLHVLDVLSRFPWLRGDGRLQDGGGAAVEGG